MLKNPFEIALYQLLFWQVKPRTVIEIGSYRGGSALWFADMMRNFDAVGKVISIDVKPPTPPYQRDDVSFLEGDANTLGTVLTSETFEAVERPLLVVEDADHNADTTLAVLDFFAPLLRSAEYIVIEDALVSDLGMAHRFNGGPGLAISRFLAAHPNFRSTRRCAISTATILPGIRTVTSDVCKSPQYLFAGHEAIPQPAACR